MFKYSAHLLQSNAKESSLWCARQFLNKYEEHHVVSQALTG
jgi:hypothetical protein